MTAIPMALHRPAPAAALDVRPIAFVTAKDEPVSRVRHVAWPALLTMLSDVKIGPKNGPGWLPAEIDKGPRAAARVRSVSFLALDIEAEAEATKDENGEPITDAHGERIKNVIGPEPPSVDDMLAELELRGWRAMLHTSYSHTTEHARYRLIFDLSRPLRPDELRPLALHLASLIGVSDCVDTTCMEPARLFYLPRCRGERVELFRHGSVDGEPLDVDELLSDAAKIEAAHQAARSRRHGERSGNVIDAFNAAHDIGTILTRHGYIARGRRRWLHPSSTTGEPGVRLIPDSTPERIYSSHGADPLNDGHAHDAFDLYRILDHGGDLRAAVKAAARMLGMDHPKPAGSPTSGAGSGDVGNDHDALSGSTGGDLGAWPEPAPLPAALPPVEAFAPELMPAALRPWVSDIAERVQCPPDFVAVAAMVGLGSVLGRRIALYPKRRDDWCEFANQWGLVIGPPGVLKSPAIREALRPLRKLEHAASERHADEVSQWREEAARRGIVRAAAKSNALKAASKGNDFDASGLIETGDPDEPGMRRYVVNDSSVEALGEVLRGNPHGTLVYQDELAGLLRQLDREGNEGARAFWLAGWSGSEPYTFDRIGRGLNRRVDAVCLALFGSIQPAVIGDYLRDAAMNGGGDGLMARMSMLVWPDVVGEWRNVDEYPDTQARRAAVEVFERFDAITGPDVGGEADERGHHALRFGDDAQAEFNAWREGFERAQREADIHPALIAHRNKYRKAVPALALIAHLVDHPGGGPVGKAALLRALAWVEYLDSHAQRAYASVTRTDADGARELLRRIRRGDVADPFRVRDVYRNGWRLLAEPEQVHRAARLLVEFDYLRERVEDTGGRAATVYDVNPRGRQ